MSTFQIVSVCILSATCIMLVAVFLWHVARRRQSQFGASPAPQPTLTDPTGLDGLLQSMSGRVAAVEGRLGAVAAELQGVAILQQRLAAVEAAMPSMQEAYEKYGDQVARADKRATERDRVEKKTAQSFQTAGEAAADLGAAGAGGIPTLTQPAAPPTPPNGKYPGVVGSGGRGKFAGGD